MYYKDIRHSGLGKYRRVSGSDLYVLDQRVRAQLQIWNDQWQRRCEIEQKRNERQSVLERLESKKAKALRLTTEAQHRIDDLKSILLIGTTSAVQFDWNSLKDQTPYPEPPLALPKMPADPSPPNPAFVPSLKLTFWAYLFSSIRQRQEDQHRKDIETASAEQAKAQRNWERERSQIAHERERLLAGHEKSVAAWRARKTAFEATQVENNAKVDALKDSYLRGERESVIEYIDSILARSDYPEYFPKQWSIDFAQESGVMIIDYELPPVDGLPKLRAVKFVQSRDVLEESYLKDSEIAQIYDSAMYQTCLRSLYEVFSLDESSAIKSITFNGWVSFIDKSNGRPARSCIMSLQASKEALLGINLDAIDPKACFRALKGVGSAKLAGMAAVVPILRLNKKDDRFINSRDVIDGVQEVTNIAAISWEDFEYLVRDIFEKEFSANGGEVKITRASRDHGVDAIAFDPDPIRGGKIVIQAKRYTNLVGVSAVRDLYGTLINEGANSGILVTTSQYGPDSYDFAKDKPIKLLDGGNLLSLLERHGHPARIDLAEAKKLGASRDER